MSGVVFACAVLAVVLALLYPELCDLGHDFAQAVQRGRSRSGRRRMTTWEDRRRVLRTVATGGQPGDGDADAVAELVGRGLLERFGTAGASGVLLTPLGRDVMDDEPGTSMS